jgi:urease accessory protein UreH
VDADGRAELLEVITPGATNATFTFRQLVFETILRKPERVVAREKYRLTPRSRGQLAGYTHYGSLLLVGTGLDDERRKRLAECRMVQAGASELPGGGAVVKMLGRSAQTVRGALLDVLPYAAWVNRFFPL